MNDLDRKRIECLTKQNAKLTVENVDLFDKAERLREEVKLQRSFKEGYIKDLEDVLGEGACDNPISLALAKQRGKAAERPDTLVIDTDTGDWTCRECGNVQSSSGWTKVCRDCGNCPSVPSAKFDAR